ncbi:STAS domain-containing protein [Catellatospora sp. TT07R-123]|uniref:STAS domain-containing protein n=1 Tax=Catellatospora sp. TT07R-123 TaxID=2733863 RepID=UPI0035B508B4
MAGQAGQDMVVGCLIRLRGELDLMTADGVAVGLRAAIDTAVRRHARLDLAQLRFMDARGLAVLLGAAAYARTRCSRWDVVGACAQVARVIAVTGAGRALGIGDARGL